MATRVQAIPNPRFQVSPLTSTGGSIVSTRRVKIPVTNPTTFTGVRATGANASGQTFLYFDLADNECFLDVKKMVLCMDMTVYGPNEGNTNARTSGNNLPLVFDQSTQAIIASLTIGSPQGLKFEEIQEYNLLANTISYHTETRMHKEASMLDRSAFYKTSDKDNGLNKLTDGVLTFIGQAQIQVGVKQRVHLRFHHSSFLNSMDMIPLFLLRNGLRIQVQFESAMKVFHMPISSSPSTDFVLSMALGHKNIPNWFIGAGSEVFGATTTSRAAVAQNVLSGSYYPPSPRLMNTLITNATGTPTAVPSYNTLWLPANAVNQLKSRIPSYFSPSIGLAQDDITPTYQYAVPISLYEHGTLVWNGFILVVPGSYETDKISSFTELDHGNLTHQHAIAAYCTNATASTWGLTNVTSTVNVSNATDLDRQNSELNARAPYIHDQGSENTTDSGSTLDTLNLASWTTAGVDGDGTESRFAGFKMYTYNDLQQYPYISFVTATTADHLADANQALINKSTKLCLHVKDAVTLIRRGSTLQTVRQFVLENSKNALAGALSLWTIPSSYRTVRYKCEQAEMLAELVKPSAEDFLRYQTNFSGPAGIAYKFNRWLYRKTTQNLSSGTVQINLPISVRSMTKLLVIIQDINCDMEPNNAINSLMMANLSTGQRRGCTRAEVVIGGQLYPIYPLLFKPDGGQYGADHIPETEKFFGVSGSGSIQGSFAPLSLKQIRNYLAGGWLQSTQTNVAAMFSDVNSRLTYVDASKFFLAFSLAKDDMLPFTTGIDSSQSGAVSLNLYFQDPLKDPASGFQSNQQFDVHTFVGCDAVATLQLSANLVRY